MSRPDALPARGPGLAGIPDVFIYYRVEAADEAAIRARVADFQMALCRQFDALRARLLRRHEGPAEGTLLTLMETYSFDSAGSGQRPASLEVWLAAIDRAAAQIAPLIQGDRKVEVFETCA